MKSKDPSEIWIIANELRNKYPLWSELDSIFTILIAKLISDNKKFYNTSEMNKIIKKKYPVLVHEKEIPPDIIERFQDVKITNKDVDFFIKKLIDYKRLGFFDFTPEDMDAVPNWTTVVNMMFSLLGLILLLTGIVFILMK